MNAPLCEWELALELACQHANDIDTADPVDALNASQDTLERLGWGNETYGIEYISAPGERKRELAFLNTGDTYSLTVGFTEKDGCFITSWGVWYEYYEDEHEEDTGTICCGYCGEYTPLTDPDNWSETVCEYCGNLVGG